VRRFALALIVTLLAFSASGVTALVVPEPCGTSEEAGGDDASCPPTCVTCGCCAQAAEPAGLTVAAIFESPVAVVTPAVPPRPLNNARDILHVPKLRLA
jgi:hypothetical protein